MAASGFYDVDALETIAINLFYGWGYNFYRLENQLRADDQLVRAKACSLLGEARASLEGAEASYRRDNIPAPTRAKPFPDAAVIAGAQAIERLSRALGTLEAQVRAQPAPESDRMSELYRREADLLVRLRACDMRLIGQAELLRAALDRAGAATVLARGADARRRSRGDGGHAARAPGAVRQPGLTRRRKIRWWRGGGRVAEQGGRGPAPPRSKP